MLSVLSCKCSPWYLAEWLNAEPLLWSMHSPAWWRKHWERTGIVDVELADSMPDGWRLWLEWHRIIAPENHLEIETVEADGGRHFGYNRVVGRRLPNVSVNEPINSIPSSYSPKPLLRGGS